MTATGGDGRAKLPFRSVNRQGAPGHDPGLQRHHLLPCQLLRLPSLRRLLRAMGGARTRFDDFRRNGILLPATGAAARRLALPLHRGPHRHYNEMVIERVGQIEGRWSAHQARFPREAGEEALFRLAVLQSALRRRLLDPPSRPLRLNRHDPIGSGYDFTELDGMVEALWGGTHAALRDNAVEASRYSSASRSTRSATLSTAGTMPTP